MIKTEYRLTVRRGGKPAFAKATAGRQNTESAFAEASADRYRIWILIIAAIAVIFAAFGCREKRVPETATPVRIITISPNITEIAFALGLGEKIIAVSSEKIKVGSFWQPDIEAVIAAKPDLVITEKYENQKAIADNLERLGYKVLNLKMETIADLFTAIQKVGDAAGCRQRSEIVAKDIQKQINNIKAKSASMSKVKVLWVIQPDPLRVAGRNTFINGMIEIAGGENAIGATIQPYPPISGEELSGCGAEVIIQSAMGTAGISEQKKTAELFWSKFSNLPAVINNKVFVINADTVLRLGPRLPEGIEAVALLLHPEEFSEKTGVDKDLK
jgi:iron complex transport system substrate-binding protein